MRQQEEFLLDTGFSQKKIKLTATYRLNAIQNME